MKHKSAEIEPTTQASRLLRDLLCAAPITEPITILNIDCIQKSEGGTSKICITSNTSHPICDMRRGAYMFENKPKSWQHLHDI